MKEVNAMETMVRAVRAHGVWVVECSEHGLIAVATDADVDRAAVEHMEQEHGAAAAVS